MTSALQLPSRARTSTARQTWPLPPGAQQTASTCPDVTAPIRPQSPRPSHQRSAPLATLAFYRKHTQVLLRRYLYASMLVARAPSILQEPIVRGWASSRPVETFEDCVIFVLDMEKALDRLSALDHLLITRIAIQEYTFAETALLLNRGERIIILRFGQAIDRLTAILLDDGTLRLPHCHPAPRHPDLLG